MAGRGAQLRCVLFDAAHCVTTELQSFDQYSRLPSIREFLSNPRPDSRLLRWILSHRRRVFRHLPWFLVRLQRQVVSNSLTA
jgi:hypothetical protein